MTTACPGVTCPFCSAARTESRSSASALFVGPISTGTAPKVSASRTAVRGSGVIASSGCRGR